MDFDRFYDNQAAGTALETLSRQKVATIDRRNDPAVQHLSSINIENIVVQETNEGGQPKWKLAAVTPDGDMESEVVFRMQGVLTRVELVPGNITRLDHKKVANLSQQVQIVGLGGSTFTRSVRGTKVVQDVFDRFFGSGRVERWNNGDRAGADYITLSSRYVTYERGNLDDKEIPFGPGVDPLKAFAKFRESGLIHTVENQVIYGKTVKEADSERYSTQAAFPGSFRRGDIVDVHGSIVAYVDRHKNVRTHFQLRALTLLESKYSMAAEQAKIDQAAADYKVVSLKRKILFEDEDGDVVNTRKKFKDLHVNDDSGK